MNKSTISEISIIISVLIAITSANPWFTWQNSLIKISLLGLFLVLRTYLSTKYIRKQILNPLISCIFLCVYLYAFHSITISDAFTTIFTRTLPLIFFILFNNYEKSRYIKLLTNVLSGILIVSLIFFILFHFNIKLPYSRITNADAFYNEMYNYYAFIIPGHSGIFTRFQSIFTEPGHLGMIIALLLYITGYNFRTWQFWILIISLIWTFSLAAYLLLIIGFIIYKISEASNSIKYILITPLICLIFIIPINIYYNLHPDSMVSSMILDRLQFDENKGITGNNRNTYEFMQYYKQFIHSDKLYLGLGSQYTKLGFISGNSSYRCFIMQSGLLGILLLGLFYISCIIPKSSKQYWGLFLLYCFSFWQRPYALWEIESFSFIAFSCYTYKKNKI